MQTEAAVLYQMGMPLPYEESQPLSIETIELEGPGPGEVLVEIASAGLCHSDLSVMNGSRPRVMPLVMGHEAAGIVRETGTGVQGLAVDDHVVFSFIPSCGHCGFCLGGRSYMCEHGVKAGVEGCLLNGRRKFKNSRGESLHHHLGVSGFSRYTVAVQESLIKIDASFPLEKAALFGCAVLTGAGAVINRARVSPGESAAVFGLGGVGLSAVLGAKASGAVPLIAVDPQPAKRDLALALGATHVVDPSNDNVIDTIKEITNGGVYFAFEMAGITSVLEQAYACTAKGGTTVTIGLPHPKDRLDIQTVSLVAEERTLLGSYMGSCVPARDIPRFIEMYKQGHLQADALVSRHVKLEDLNRAFDALHHGKEIRQILTFD